MKMWPQPFHGVPAQKYYADVLTVGIKGIILVKW
jgi:hypothetical protein